MAEASPAAAAEQAGIPQLDFSTFPNQIFWLAVFLLVLFLIVRRVAIPRIDGILEARRDRIEEDLKQAEQASQEVDRLRQATESALENAKTEAEKIAADTRGRIRQSQDEALAKAASEINRLAAASEERINEIRDGASETVREVASAAAIEIMESILPSRAAEEAVRARVDARLGGGQP